MEESEAKLQPGVAFRLQPDGQWKPEKIPPEVLKEAKFSGYLTIQGYRCTVFDTPDQNQWAQKSTGTPDTKPTTAAQLAEEWLLSHGARPPAVQPMRSLITSRVASLIATRWLLGAEDGPRKTITFEMPGDQDWDPEIWDKLGVGQEWERLGRAFYNAGVEVDDTEDIVLEFDADKETEVRQIIDAARAGNFGPDVKTYWSAAQEVVETPTSNDFRKNLESAIAEWNKNNPEESDSAEVVPNEYYLYAESILGTESYKEGPGIVWQLIRDRDGDDYSVYESNPGEFDIEAAEKSMQEDLAENPRDTVASRIATRWFRAQGDVTSLVQKKMDRDGDDKAYDKAIVDFVTKTRTKLPSIDAALSKACDVLLNTREKIEHKHPKVQDRYVQLFLQELAQKHRELEDMRKQLMRGLTVELDRYEAEANPIIEGEVIP